jgi:hypothetical protein
MDRISDNINDDDSDDDKTIKDQDDEALKLEQVLVEYVTNHTKKIKRRFKTSR